MVEEKRFDKLEDEIKEVADATTKNTVALAELTVLIKELAKGSLKEVKKTLADHEDRIRANSKFTYQAVAVATVISIVIGWVVRFI